MGGQGVGVGGVLWEKRVCGMRWGGTQGAGWGVWGGLLPPAGCEAPCRV